MPVKNVLKKHSRAPRHKQTKNYLQTYWPYLPMLMLVILGLIFGGSRPLQLPSKHSVLAYATDMSAGGLLSGTNSERNNNGQASLTINQQLTNAAQAKANDMVARNYWSHNTPDGLPPWTFIQNAGYKYIKAGENLAYGFATSSDTITGWMGSASHKANMLDPAFTEVGFGIANSSDFNSSGPETVVVAMYGEPQVLSQSTQAAPAPTPAAAAKPAPQPTTTPPPTETPKPTTNSTPVTTATSHSEPTTKAVTRASLWTGGRLPWLISGLGMLTGISLVILLVRHGWGFRRLLRDSEQFVLRHPLVDIMLVAIIMLAYVLSATKGFIK